MYAHEKIIIKHQQDAFPLTFSPDGNLMVVLHHVVRSLEQAESRKILTENAIRKDTNGDEHAWIIQNHNYFCYCMRIVEWAAIESKKFENEYTLPFLAINFKSRPIGRSKCDGIVVPKSLN